MEYSTNNSTCVRYFENETMLKQNRTNRTIKNPEPHETRNRIAIAYNKPQMADELNRLGGPANAYRVEG